MNAFDGEADAKRPPPVDMIELARGDTQEGPQPLAAADRGMAHRVIEPVPRVLRHRGQAVQPPVDLGADFRERGFQLVQRLPPRRVTPRRRAQCRWAAHPGRTEFSRSAPARPSTEPRTAVSTRSEEHTSELQSLM